jgi:hypothetical protein
VDGFAQVNNYILYMYKEKIYNYCEE